MPHATTSWVTAGVYVVAVTVLGILAFTPKKATWPSSLGHHRYLPNQHRGPHDPLGKRLVSTAPGVNTQDWLAAILIAPAFIGAACVNVWVAGSMVRARRLTSQGRSGPAAKAP